jgi:hypothetical protein
LNHWNGKDFKELEQPFPPIDSIILHAQNHKAYSLVFTLRQKEAFILTSMSAYRLPHSYRATAFLQCTYQIEKLYPATW